MRLPVIFRKTLGDFSNPKLLAAYFVPFLAVGGFLALGLTNSEAFDGIASYPLHVQEAELLNVFAPMSYIWGAGVPLLAIGAVLGANALAKEAQSGTLRILLSKPIRRWEVLVGMYLATVVFTFVLGVASLLLMATAIFVFSGADAGALAGGVFAIMPGNLLYALFVAVIVGALSVALSVFTRNRLKTVLALIVLPVLYFVFIMVRALAAESYEDFSLYLVDVNYHFGNVFVFLHGLTGSSFSPEAQAGLATWTGVYDARTAVVDPLVGGMPTSLELTAHVPQVASLLLLLALPLLLFGAAAYRFERMDL